MDLMKALVPSTILTLIVAAIVGSTGSSGNFLTLESAEVAGHSFHWSWPFFMTVMAINAVLIARIGKAARG
jgi:hypothetical protein